jgi:hypothetical protein
MKGAGLGPGVTGSYRVAAAVLLMLTPAFGAVTGTIINRTTGAPQAGAAVGLDKLGQSGPEPVAETKADAQGRFTIAQDTSGQAPFLLRADYDGVRYYHVLPPGTPASGITLDVYNASKKAGEAKVGKHMILFQPGDGKLTVNETYILENGGKTAWNDPDQGTVPFFLPAGAEGKADVQATEPGGMPIAAGVKTGKNGMYGVDFAVKPGETRIDVSYSLPYTAGAPYSGKVASRDENTYLIAPNGVTLAGKGLKDLGTEPRTQAHIFGLAANAYDVTLTGAVAAAPADNGGADASESSGPQIEQIMPRLYTQVVPILGIALGILALGFALLYRAGPGGARPLREAAAGGKEAHERGRR